LVKILNTSIIIQLSSGLIVLIAFTFTSCSNTCKNNSVAEKPFKENYQYYFTYDATFYTDEDSIFPKMIIFTKDYKDDTIKLLLKNKVIFQNIISTNYSNGVADQIILDSIIDRSFFDANYKDLVIGINKDCRISLDTLGQYKFYYIAKVKRLIHVDHTNFYKILY
jgi:hypothetical protein